MKPRVAVVGGGWAGLAAAVTLVDAGHAVVLHESARQLGGRARRVDWHGIAIDNGQHLCAGAYDHTLDLLRRLGTAAGLERRRLVFDEPGFRLALPGLPRPLHLAVGLLTARGLDAGEKYAAARFMRALARRRFRLDRDDTAARLLAEHGQPGRLVARLWQPICVAALNTPLAQASAQIFCNVLRDSLAGPRAASDMLFNRGDLGRLVPDAAARHVGERGGSIHLSSRVTGLVREADGFRLAGPDDRAERVVLATHPAQAPALLAGLPGCDGLVGQLRDLRWQPILTLWLRFAAPLALPYPMLALGDGSAPWAFERNDLGPGLAAIVFSAEGPHLALAPAALRDDCLERLGRRVGPLPPLADWRVIVEKRATFACTPGLRRPDPRTPVPGLFLAGDYTAGDYPATLEGAVRSGVKCARMIIEEE
ncbi:desaturase [Parasulfuritortus cantonensis]|uniref:Desaturase n=1 Tax=Parasulfuritortus cantonensis TaxID=2528202 RepID=A0A4R1B0L1_9PROT|nr:desaturase [Parasulfuritortus cantonensis]